MKTHNLKFVQGFHKVAASELPDWLRSAHKKIDGIKAMPSYSKHGIRHMMKRRGVK